MPITVSVDPAGMTQQQRQAVADFILSYPASSCSGKGECHTAAVAEIHVHPEIERLAHEQASTLPVAAFGEPDPAVAAFGTPTPLALGATAAPSTAAAAPLPTVPAVTLAPTSTPAMSAPIPPAPPAAPSAPIAAPQTGSPAAGVELDKHGLPWDARIHAESRAKVADGSWRMRRNLDPAVRATVEAELRQVMGAAPASPLAAQPAATVTTPTAGSASSAATAPVPPITPPPPSPLAQTAAPGVDLRQQFVSLVGRASAAIQAKKVTQAEITQCCAEAGVPALPLLANRLDLVPQVAANVDALIAARP